MRSTNLAQPKSLVHFLTVAVLLVLSCSALAADRGGLSQGNSAYVYVGAYDGSSDVIAAFSAAADGSLQPVPGSPFNLPSFSLVASGYRLFGDDLQNIASYSVASNGALSETAVVNGLAYVPDPQDQYVSAINVDRTGQVLNAVDTCGSCNSEVLPWMIGANGQLSYMSTPTVPSGPAKWQGELTFSADNRFAYTPIAQSFGMLRRSSNGTLAFINPGPVNAPPLPNPQEQVCNINTVAASAQGFVTLAWYGGGLGCNENGYVLGNYTVQSNGGLSFVPGSQVSPAVQESAMAFDPSGSYLAIAGNGGIQILEVQSNGSMRVLTVPLPVPGLNYVSWDGAGHVYALGDSLYVFNFNGQALAQAPGSPHAISNPVSLAVVPAS